MRFRTFLERRENDYGRFLHDLLHACKGKGDLVTIGQVKGLDAYQVVINPNAKRTLCFVSGIHGNEIAGPLAALEFIEKMHIEDDVRVLLYPLVTPYGFERFTRTGAHRLNINRQWSKGDMKHEAAALRDSIASERVDFLHSLHEDIAGDGLYLYYSNPKQKTQCKEILALGQKYMEIESRKTIYGDKVEEPGLILVNPDNEDAKFAKSFESWMYRRGTEYFCTETPSKHPLETRIACNLAMMQFVVSVFHELTN